MRIKPQMAVDKKSSKPSFSEWVAQIKDTQEEYKGAKAAGDVAGMKRALSRVDEMQRGCSDAAVRTTCLASGASLLAAQDTYVVGGYK